MTVHAKIAPHIYIYIYIYGIEAANRDLAHNVSSFQIISYSKRQLCPLQLLSYALEISLSIMELQGPQFFYYTYIFLARVTLMLLPGNFYNMR